MQVLPLQIAWVPFCCPYCSPNSRLVRDVTVAPLLRPTRQFPHSGLRRPWLSENTLLQPAADARLVVLTIHLTRMMTHVSRSGNAFPPKVSLAKRSVVAPALP